MDYSIRERSCLSILTVFQDLQVIPKKEATLFPLRATRSFREDRLRKRYPAISEKQVAFWLNIDFHWHRLRVGLHRKQNSVSSGFRRQHF